MDSNQKIIILLKLEGYLTSIIDKKVRMKKSSSKRWARKAEEEASKTLFRIN
jgi:transposase